MPTPPQRPRVIFNPDADELKTAAPPPDGAPRRPFAPDATPAPAPPLPGGSPRLPAAPEVAPAPTPPLPDGAPRRPFAPDAPAEAAPIAPNAEVASPMTERQRAAHNADARTPKVKPYHGSCPACGHGSMFPLVRYHETDVNENPTADAVMPNRLGAQLFPGVSFMIMIITWLGGMSWDKGRVARGRAKVRKAREEILPRCPQAMICPRCQEVLERF